MPKQSDYSVGDVVFWGTPTTAGEYTFIGHPKGDKGGKVLVLAMAQKLALKLTRTNAPRLVAATRSAVAGTASDIPQSSGRVGRESDRAPTTIALAM